MNISYIRLLQAIESFASAHLQIQKFASDFPSQMPNFATTDEAYPILFVSPTTSIFDENTTTFEVDIYCFDIIQKDRGNINTILSDTNLILSDFTRWFRDNDDIFIELMSSSATPIDNALLDYAAGWVMRVVFEVSTYGVCEIPFDEAPIIITEVNDIVYSRWLTCETLEDCPVIINIQDQLSGLTGSTGEYLPLSGGTVTGNTIFTSGLTANTISATTYYNLPIENITPDSYLGLRLKPTDPSNNGFYINKSENQSVGYYVRNTDNVGNGAISAIYVGGTGGLYDNYASLFHANNGYSIPYLRNNNGLVTNNDFFFVGWKGSSFDFRTGGNTFGSETSKFKISSGGTLNIGIQPSLDNTITDILGRKSDGTIIRIDKSTLTGSTPNLQDVTTAGSITTNSMTVESDFFNTIIETSGVTTTDLGTNEFTSVKPTGVFITNNSSMGLGLSGTTGIGLNSQNYQWKFENGEIFLYDIVNNYIAIKDYSLGIPLLTDDLSKGYVGGSIWKVGGGQTYVCSDPTIGAAVWEQSVSYGNLQNVTDNGANTTNDIKVYNLSDNKQSSIESTLVTSIDIDANTYANLQNEGIIGVNSNGVYDGLFKSSLLTQGNVTLEFPNKTSNTYTIATLDDLSGFSSTDIFVTGGTYSNGTSTFTNNTGGTFSVTGFNTTSGTVTSVSALTIGTTGTDITSTVANATTTPVITLNIPTASASNRGALSSADWISFNNRKKKIISDTTSAIVSGTTSLTLVKTYELTAGTLSTDGILDLFMYSTRTGTSAIHTMGLYINTTNNFAGATLVTSLATAGNFTPILSYKANFVLKDNLLIGGPSSQTTGTNYVTATSQISVACNNTSSSVWFFVGITPANVGQTITLQAIELIN